VITAYKTSNFNNVFDWTALTEVPARRGILNFMKFAQQLLLVCLVGMALGCGQKGPLVMPDAQKHKRTITIPTAPGVPAKPAVGGAASPAPQGSAPATSPAPPATPAPTPGTPPATAP
jgi:predicted small lipoprotein YifL